MKTGAIFDSERATSRDAENISDEQDAASVYGISSVLHATCIVFPNVLRVLATETSVSRYLVDAGRLVLQFGPHAARTSVGI